MAIYNVFARDDLKDPISLVGEVEAADDSAARQAALDLATSSAVEVTMVPADSLHWVVQPKEGSAVR